MNRSNRPPSQDAHRQIVRRLVAGTTVVVALGACQPDEQPRHTAPLVAKPAPAVAPTESAVKSMLLQYQDAGALQQNGFQIAEEGGIVPLDQFDKWTPVQLRELLQFVDSPNNGLSEATTRNLGRALREALHDKQEPPPAVVSRTPAMPPKAAL